MGTEIIFNNFIVLNADDVFLDSKVFGNDHNNNKFRCNLSSVCPCTQHNTILMANWNE